MSTIYNMRTHSYCVCENCETTESVDMRITILWSCDIVAWPGINTSEA